MYHGIQHRVNPLQHERRRDGREECNEISAENIHFGTNSLAVQSTISNCRVNTHLVPDRRRDGMSGRVRIHTSTRWKEQLGSTIYNLLAYTHTSTGQHSVSLAPSPCAPPPWRGDNATFMLVARLRPPGGDRALP